MSSLLGIPDGEIGSGDKVSWETNKIGGKPDWMIEGCDLPVCTVCGVRMSLVVQIYCPLKDSLYHRILYISACSTKSCWNKAHSWKVMRSEILDENSNQTASNNGQMSTDDWGVMQDDWGDSDVTMETTDWCDGADDWGDEESTAVASKIPSHETDPNKSYLESLKFEQMNIIDDSFELHSNHSDNSELTSNIVQSEADEIDPNSVKSVLGLLAIGDKSVTCDEFGIRAPVCTDSFKPQILSNSKTTSEICGIKAPLSAREPFTSYYLSVINESDYETDHKQIEQLVKNYEKESGTDLKTLLKSKNEASSTAGGVEEYEKTDIKGDKFSHKFLKRLKNCPQQCIRYEWNSEPMFISQPSEDYVKGVLCNNCNGPLVFELQLMPPLINFLHNKNGDTCEFGTVLIYTCRNSCWKPDDKLLVETCFIQSDPDSHLFKI